MGSKTIKAGEEFEVRRVGEGRYELSRKKAKRKGLLACLRSCPEQDWFMPLESESTDTL